MENRIPNIVAITWPVMNVIVKAAAMQHVPGRPTTVYIEIWADDLCAYRDVHSFCDCCASDAMLRELAFVCKAIGEQIPLPQSLHIVLGNTIAYAYVTNQAYPATNSTRSALKSVNKRLKRLRPTWALATLDPAFVQFRRSDTERFMSSKVEAPTLLVDSVVDTL